MFSPHVIWLSVKVFLRLTNMDYSIILLLLLQTGSICSYTVKKHAPKTRDRPPAPHYFKPKTGSLERYKKKSLFEETYISDIVGRHKVRNRAELEEILNILSSAIGSLTNPRKLSAAFKSMKQKNISQNTIKNYNGIAGGGGCDSLSENTGGGEAAGDTQFPEPGNRCQNTGRVS